MPKTSNTKLYLTLTTTLGSICCCYYNTAEETGLERLSVVTCQGSPIKKAEPGERQTPELLLAPPGPTQT